MVRLDGLREAQAGAAVGRAAPARGPRPRARQPAARAAARRAARRARPQAPRGDADRAQGHPAAGRDHVHLRHPRPGGGAHDERPARGVQRRADRAGRGARPRSTSGRRRASWPGSSARPTCSRARWRERIVGRPGTFTIRPEKIHMSAGGQAAGRGRDGRRRRSSATSSTSARTRATSSMLDARRPARGHPAEPRDVLDRGARAARQGCPPDLEATARTPHRGWGRLIAPRRRAEEEDRCDIEGSRRR